MILNFLPKPIIPLAPLEASSLLSLETMKEVPASALARLEEAAAKDAIWGGRVLVLGRRREGKIELLEEEGKGRSER